MKQHPRSVTVALAALVTLAGLTACGGSGPSNTVAADCSPQSTFPTIDEGVLKVAAMNAPPYFFSQDESGPYEGIAGPLIIRFAEENCLTLELKPMTGAAAVLDVTKGRSDILLGNFPKKPERAEILNQTRGELMFDTLGITSEPGWNSVEQLKGKKVGVQSGSSYTDPLKAYLGADNVIEYQKDVNAFEDLKAGRIEATAMSSLLGTQLSRNDPDYETNVVQPNEANAALTEVLGTTWPNQKGADELTEAIDAFFEEVRGDGTLQSALSKAKIDNTAFYIDGER